MSWSLTLLILFVSVAEKINAEEEWNGGRPPPFFPQGKERPIPRYAPTFSRYTPFLTEDTLPKPVYGHSSHSSESPPSIYKSQGRSIPREFSRESSEEDREPNNYPPFQRPPLPYYGPGMFHGMLPPQRPPPSSRREYPEPFHGPRGEVEDRSREEEEAPPPFLPPQYRGQRIPPPEYFSRKENGGERPFFGPLPSAYSKQGQQQKPSEAVITTPFPASKPQSSNYSAPEHGSEVQLEKGKSRPDRLFAVKPPEFLPIPSPPPYPSPAPFTPPPSTPKIGAAFSEVTHRPPPSIYSPLQGPFPEETTHPTDNAPPPTQRQQPPSQERSPPSQGQGQQGQPGKPKPNVLPQSFRSFFPPGFGPFADGKIQRFQ